MARWAVPVAGIVERLVPDELRELFQRVVPEAPSRPQGGGRRRHGDREVLAAIVFVATSGCTWQRLPAASFGPSRATAHRRFAEWSKARVWAKQHGWLSHGRSPTSVAEANMSQTIVKLSPPR
ncbi:hypothetical protein GCM10018953_46850 [Streptosporangium nondiastaticum]